MATKRSGKRVSVFSKKHKHIPMKKTDYVKQGGKWKPINVEREVISEEQAGWILGSAGLPFERSHRREKKDRYGHSHPYDIFSSISPDGRQKTTWSVDFATGDRNYSKLVHKSYQDTIRRKKKKAAK